MKKCPKSFKNMDFLDFGGFRGHVYPAHGRHSGSSAVPRAEVIDKIQLKKIKNKNTTFPKRFIFSMKNMFRKILKNRKFQKVTFFENQT